MLEHSYRIVTTNVFPYEKQIRRFLIFAAILLFVLWSVGLYFGLLWDVAIVFVIFAFVVTIISRLRIKEVGSLSFLHDKMEWKVDGIIKTLNWENIRDVDFSKLHSSIFQLSFDEFTFLLKLSKSELMELEDFLESKDLMEETAWPFFHR